jgi:excisionase family DNA binding protein
MNGKLLNIDQVAEYLGVHRDTVYNLIRSGRLPALQLGGRKAGWRITEDDLHNFVQTSKSANNRPSEDEEQALAKFDRRQSEDLDTFRASQSDARERFISDRQTGRKET